MISAFDLVGDFIDIIVTAIEGLGSGSAAGIAYRVSVPFSARDR
ncbi:MAG: hypothetical protein ABI647_24770 [Gemmatimonadota bacterium]